MESATNPAETHTYYVSTSEGAGANANFSIMPGDVVVMGTVGTVSAAATGGISLSGTGPFSIVGVAAQSAPATPATQTAVLVYDDPLQVFVVQDDGVATAGMGSATSGGAAGLMYRFNATATSGGQSQATGNTARSTMVIQSTSYSANTNRVLAASATTQVPILVLGLHPIEYTPNAAASSVIPSASGQFRKWLVRFNRHLFMPTVG